MIRHGQHQDTGAGSDGRDAAAGQDLPAVSTEPRRFFMMDDGTDYTVVARDLEHAKEILRKSGAEFGQYGTSLDEADANGELDWREMPDEQVYRTNVYLDEGKTRVPLAGCKLGDWFCSEW